MFIYYSNFDEFKKAFEEEYKDCLDHNEINYDALLNFWEDHAKTFGAVFGIDDVFVRSADNYYLAPKFTRKNRKAVLKNWTLYVHTTFGNTEIYSPIREF